jgi:hypothetical protein
MGTLSGIRHPLFLPVLLQRQPDRPRSTGAGTGEPPEELGQRKRSIKFGVPFGKGRGVVDQLDDHVGESLLKSDLCLAGRITSDQSTCVLLGFGRPSFVTISISASSRSPMSTFEMISVIAGVSLAIVVNNLPIVGGPLAACTGRISGAVSFRRSAALERASAFVGPDRIVAWLDKGMMPSRCPPGC